LRDGGGLGDADWAAGTRNTGHDETRHAEGFPARDTVAIEFVVEAGARRAVVLLPRTSRLVNNTVGVLARAVRGFDTFSFVEDLVCGALTTWFAHEAGHTRVLVLVGLACPRTRFAGHVLHVGLACWLSCWHERSGEAFSS